MKNQDIGGVCLRRGALGQIADLRGGGGLDKKEGSGVFEEEGLIPQCQLCQKKPFLQINCETMHGY